MRFNSRRTNIIYFINYQKNYLRQMLGNLFGLTIHCFFFDKAIIIAFVRHAIYFRPDRFVQTLSLLPILILLLNFLVSIDLEIYWFIEKLEEKKSS